jgi:hypothetical protein
MAEMKTLLVTGDIVLDCHLYGGVKTFATSYSEPGTVYIEHLGGAALTCELVLATANPEGFIYDKKLQKWQEARERCKKNGMNLPPKPRELRIKHPVGMYNVQLDLDTADLEESLPKHLRSYGVWVDQPTHKNAKSHVWRIERHFGYGPSEPAELNGIFRRKTFASPIQPSLTLIDDGAILFRHSTASAAWPDFSAGKPGYFLMKMSPPLCQSDLWEKMMPIMERLILVVSARDLRGEDAQISSKLSWEQCAEHTIAALENHPIVRDLLRAKHVIINFGSAGALWVESEKKHALKYKLFYDPETLDGDFSQQLNGSAYGFQTCLTAGIAHHLMQGEANAGLENDVSILADSQRMEKALSQGIKAGLEARRLLIQVGHDFVEDKEPAFPCLQLGELIANPRGGQVNIGVPTSKERSSCQWTILRQSEVASGDDPMRPLSGLAELTARYGFIALSKIPKYHKGKLFTVDRSEIESYRTLESLMRMYEEVKVQTKPLSIGVFGPPGAGKSFGVKALAIGILDDKIPFIEFNLSQFKGPDELIGAFHRVRDAVLGGITPVVFWDEFDAQNYRWLQYLLAPMQDGSFQEGQITHPIGKCIFIFAGGTSSTMEEFGVKSAPEISAEEMEKLTPEQRRERLEAEKAWLEFQLLKGPDFISRLHGFLNVLGPNPRKDASCPDITWPIRRAIIMRGILGLGDNEELDIDPGLLNGILNVRIYNHGARSFYKVINALAPDKKRCRLSRSTLPPRPLLARETDADDFMRLISQRDAFKNHPDLENLAAAIHASFLSGADKAKLDAQMQANPHLEWTIHPAIKNNYSDLTDDMKASNRAAARRIPDHLALIGYVVVPWLKRDKNDWQKPLERALKKHIERLAEAEHLGWVAERTTNGWTYNPVRNNTAKHHPLMVPWARLSPSEQEKDRNSVRSIPELLKVARYKAVPISEEHPISGIKTRVK